MRKKSRLYKMEPILKKGSFICLDYMYLTNLLLFIDKELLKAPFLPENLNMYSRY